jgi:hypothetical protein
MKLHLKLAIDVAPSGLRCGRCPMLVSQDVAHQLVCRVFGTLDHDWARNIARRTEECVELAEP